MSDADFDDLVRRIRARDDAAVDEFVRRYEPVLRREVRLRLNDPALYRVLDPEDVCQSVLLSFFVRTAAGQYDLGGPAQLLGLLLQMARNKLAHQSRRHRALRRDVSRTSHEPVDEVSVAADDPSPSRIAAGKELLAAVRERLTDEERQIADLRAQNLSWSEIAAMMGGTPDGRRMMLTRAMDRVTAELGLDDPES